MNCDTIAGQRVELLDLMRGLTVCSMILYHGCWDMTHLFGVSWDWFHGTFRFIWQQSICWTFILLSGFCWGMSRHSVRRGATVFAAGALVTGVTMLTTPEEPVFFGVLTLLGAAMLLLTPVRPVLRRVPPVPGLLACMGLFVLFRNAKDGYFGFGAWNFHALPDTLYAGHLAACLGFPPSDFYSADYFPILPWLFLFLAGFFLYRLWEETRRPLRDIHVSAPRLCAVGRHSLGVYLVHQPVLVLILTLAFCLRAG